LQISVENVRHAYVMESKISSHLGGGPVKIAFLLATMSMFELAGLTEFDTQYNIGAFNSPSG
jgi:hypothetical protein